MYTMYSSLRSSILYSHYRARYVVSSTRHSVPRLLVLLLAIAQQYIVRCTHIYCVLYLSMSVCFASLIDWHVLGQDWPNVCGMNEAKLHHVCVMNGPKGPSCVWSKAPIRCKKYPAVAGYFIKWTINGPKRGAKKRWPDKRWSNWMVYFWSLDWINPGCPGNDKG
jgi:hypothetical protein